MLPRIVCLGWGSLIPRPAHRAGAPLAAQGVRPGLVEAGGSWHADGPRLPLELGRASAMHAPRAERYPSWVLVPGVERSPALWAELTVPAPVAMDLDRAVHEAAVALSAREGAALAQIGRWPGGPCIESDTVSTWAAERGIAGVVWTALPPKFHGEDRAPTEAEVLAMLADLVSTGDAEVAEGYLRRTPAQITSPYRRAIERTFGWSHR